MKRLMNSYVAGLLFALGLAVGGQAAAAPVLTLWDLASSGAAITKDGLIFDSWYYSLSQGAASDIEVEATNKDGGLDPGPGLQFTFGDGFTVVGPDGSATLTIGYRVRAIDPSLLLIKDNSIRLNGYGVNFDEGYTEIALVLVNEAVGTSKYGANVSSKTVFAEYTDQGGFNTGLERSTNFLTPFHDLLWAESVITLTANDYGTDDAPSSASITQLVERFSLQQVPEPATLALFGLGLGLAGLGAVRRKKLAA